MSKVSSVRAKKCSLLINVDIACKEFQKRGPKIKILTFLFTQKGSITIQGGGRSYMTSPIYPILPPWQLFLTSSAPTLSYA